MWDPLAGVGLLGADRAASHPAHGVIPTWPAQLPYWIGGRIPWLLVLGHRSLSPGHTESGAVQELMATLATMALLMSLGGVVAGMVGPGWFLIPLVMASSWTHYREWGPCCSGSPHSLHRFLPRPRDPPGDPKAIPNHLPRVASLASRPASELPRAARGPVGEQPARPGEGAACGPLWPAGGSLGQAPFSWFEPGISTRLPPGFPPHFSSHEGRKESSPDLFRESRAGLAAQCPPAPSGNATVPALQLSQPRCQPFEVGQVRKLTGTPLL